LAAKALSAVTIAPARHKVKRSRWLDTAKVSVDMDLRVDIAPGVTVPHGSDRLRLVWYTDPHSIWCWGCEPAIRRIEFLHPDVQVDVRMGGLFEDFRPMREYWTRMSGGRWKDSVTAFMDAVAGQHRMPMNAAAIAENADDFNSTWPACIAAKAAEQQGKEAARRYLRGLREAFLLEGRAIHRREVQLLIASERGLDLAEIARALDDGSAKRAFEEDLAECRREAITGFPSFVLHGANSAVRVEGYRPWEEFEEALRGIAPAPSPGRASAEDTLRAFLGRYGRCATREVAAVLGESDDETELLLDELAVDGGVVRREIGGGLFWEPIPVARGEMRPAGPKRAEAHRP